MSLFPTIASSTRKRLISLQHRAFSFAPGTYTTAYSPVSHESPPLNQSNPSPTSSDKSIRPRGIGTVDEGVDGLRVSGFMTDSTARSLAEFRSIPQQFYYSRDTSGLASRADCSDGGTANVFAIPDDYKHLAITALNLSAARDAEHELEAGTIKVETSLRSEAFADTTSEMYGITADHHTNSAHVVHPELFTTISDHSSQQPDVHQYNQHQHRPESKSSATSPLDAAARPSISVGLTSHRPQVAQQASWDLLSAP